MSKRPKADELPPTEFTIDPATPDFKRLRSVCEPGNPWRCLIATVASMTVGKRVTVRLDHGKGQGVVGVTAGAYRYERPMTPEEVAFATKFDHGDRMRKPVTVRIDLRDPAWDRKGKRAGGGKDRPARDEGRPRNARRHVKSIRERQLLAIKKAHAQTEVA